MRLVVQPADDLAFERIVNVPRRGVGEVALRTMHETARADGVPLMEAAATLVADGGLKGRVKEQIDALLRGFVRWRALLETDGHVVTVATLLDESGYTEMWQQDKSPEAPGRLENLKELVRALADFETLAGFLDHVSLVMENDESGRRRPGQPDDAARRQGAGIRHGVPAGLGGGAVPQPARAG